MQTQREKYQQEKFSFPLHTTFPITTRCFQSCLRLGVVLVLLPDCVHLYFVFDHFGYECKVMQVLGDEISKVWKVLRYQQ